MTYTYFFHLTSPFSNFHPAKFTYKDYTFISNEQFMMLSKAKNFKDEDMAKRILAINEHPLIKDFIDGVITRPEILAAHADEWNTLMMRIKKMGRDVKNYDEAFWVKKRLSVVLFGAREKFKQNRDLKELLMNTGDSHMVEASKWDRIWGIGLSESDAKRVSPDKWPGLNLLGKVLDRLKLEFTPQIEVLNFYKLNKIISEDGIYLGRASQQHNLAESIFANPFYMKTEADRDTVVIQYTDWIWQQIADQIITKNDLLNLKGKKLVCYCAPKSCHGDVVKSVVELLITNETEFDNRVQQFKGNRVKLERKICH